MTAFEDFVNLELPRRAALLTVAITGGFDADPNGPTPTPPAIITGAPVGTYYQQETPVTLWRKQPDLSWKDEDAGGGGGGSSVFQPHSIGNLYGLAGLTVPITAVVNRLTAAPILLDTARTYDRIYGRVINAGAGEFAVGVYADDVGRPGALLIDSGDLGNSTGLKFSAINFTPTSQVVWVAFRCTSTVKPSFNGALYRGDGLQLGTTEALSGAPVLSLFRSGAGAGALPDPFGSIGGTNPGNAMAMVLLRAGS